jgi:hypothetical protein
MGCWWSCVRRGEVEDKVEVEARVKSDNLYQSEPYWDFCRFQWVQKDWEGFFIEERKVGKFA